MRSPKAWLGSATHSLAFVHGGVERPILRFLLTSAQILALEAQRTGDLHLDLQVRAVLPQAPGYPASSEASVHISVAESRWRQQLENLAPALASSSPSRSPPATGPAGRPSTTCARPSANLAATISTARPSTRGAPWKQFPVLQAEPPRPAALDGTATTADQRDQLAELRLAQPRERLDPDRIARRDHPTHAVTDAEPSQQLRDSLSAAGALRRQKGRTQLGARPLVVARQSAAQRSADVRIRVRPHGQDADYGVPLPGPLQLVQRRQEHGVGAVAAQMPSNRSGVRSAMYLATALAAAAGSGLRGSRRCSFFVVVSGRAAASIASRRC
jgi:hypothetical protein